MSAYVVSKDLVDVLVAAGIEVTGRSIGESSAAKLGQALLDECVRSVSYRYPDDGPNELPGTYRPETICEGVEPIDVGEWLTPYGYTRPSEPIMREQVKDAIGSYEYQSCEHPGWEGSTAQAYCAGLRAQLERLPVPPPPAPVPPREHLGRDETIKRIRAALKRRSGKTWSVTGGRGTAWGWITIQAPPKRRTGKHVQKPGAGIGEYEHVDTGEAQEFGIMTPQDCAELAQLLGKDRPVHCQGESIPDGSDYYREYADRAEGREPSAYGVQYWD